jgi:hypothetical protein
MATIEVVRRRKWENYHETLERDGPDWRRLVASPARGEAACDYFRRTAHALQGLVAEAEGAGAPIVTLGSAWSFSNILAGRGLLLDTKDAAALFRVPAALQPGGADRRLILCHGGTRIGDLNAWLKDRRLSLFTSGAHDGQTVAGACGTGTHGSVVGYGAFQNHVRGMHLVTGSASSLWVERESCLEAAYILSFADRIAAGPDDLEAALVHLGGLGIVNAVLLEVAEDYRVGVVRRKKPMQAGWLRLLQDGQFGAFARAVWPEAPARYRDCDPYYVEVILNPFADLPGIGAKPALISLYYRQTVPEHLADEDGEPLDDVLDLIRQPSEELMRAPWLLADVVAAAFRSEPRGSSCPKLRTWGKANGAHIKLVDLFNAAYAVPRRHLADALQVIKEAFLGDDPQAAAPVVFTLRFVHEADGLLAFTAFPDTVVVNMDGLRDRSGPLAAERVALALDMAPFPSRQHWGKQGAITPGRFRAGYGDPADSSTRAGRWRSVRDALLEPAVRPVFVNDALGAWGLV